MPAVNHAPELPGSRQLRLWLAVALGAGLLFGQYGGSQYPGSTYPGGGYPGTGYPGQQYPNSGVGLPFPRKKKTNKTDKTDKAGNTSAKNEVPTQLVGGRLTNIEDKQLVLVTDDKRTVAIYRSADTKYHADGKDITVDDLRAGDTLKLDATQDEKGFFHAVDVRREKAPAEAAATKTTPSPGTGTAELPAGGPAAAEEERVVSSRPAPPTEKDPCDPGRPRIQRGRHTGTSSAKPGCEVVEDTAAPAAVPEPVVMARAGAPAPTAPTAAAKAGEPAADARIQKARAANADFTASLPSYFCLETITRYRTGARANDWQALDVISTEVIYEDKRERYQKLKLNGKPVDKKMSELDGAWSTGEFGTVVASLFSPASQTEFLERGPATIAGRSAHMYDFEIDQENSNWHIEAAGQSVLPASKGRIWIDNETSRVLRIESEAVKMPKTFPLDTVESAVDFQFVRISDRTFLLPVHAEALTCQRGSSQCTRNVMDFRNYRKYTGESNISYQ